MVSVAARGLEFRVEWQGAGVRRHSTSGSLDDFLLERYTAFTYRKGARRRFRTGRGFLHCLRG